ncbi:MAG: hypothetical protein M0Q22_00180 [Sulfuritalea sp.]|jgi:hypothetical protein|nr:hypothetical protein [Sulfuritalea sp.]
MTPRGRSLLLPLPESGKLRAFCLCRPVPGNRRDVFHRAKDMVCGFRTTRIAVPPAPTFAIPKEALDYTDNYAYFGAMRYIHDAKNWWQLPPPKLTRKSA